MVSFFDGILGRTNKAKTKDVIARATSGYGVTANADATFGSSTWDVEQAKRLAYDRSMWVYKCVNVIATQQAELDINLKNYELRRRGEPVDNKTIHRLLNERSNPYETARSLRFRLAAQLLLSSKGAFVELVRAPSDEVIALYLLPPHLVEPIKSDKNFVDGYRVKRDNQSWETVDANNIIWFNIYRDMFDMYKATPPITALRMAVDTDNLARMFNLNFLRNDGRPGTLVALKGNGLLAEDAAEIQNKFDGGYTTAGKTLVIEADDISVVDMSKTGRDVQWADTVNMAKDDITEVFGVPTSMFGNSSGRCLRESEFVHLADGSIHTAGSLVGSSFHLLQPTEDGYKVVDAHATTNGEAKIYKITTFSGRTLETNGHHPLYAASVKDNGRAKAETNPIGWTEMSKIKELWEKKDCHSVGIYTEVAVPYYFEQTTHVDHDLDDTYDAGVGLQVVPEWLFTASEDTQVAFLSGLYNNHGKLSQHTSFDLDTPTLNYARNLQRLLLRVGVHSNVTSYKNKHVVSIGGKVNMLQFLSLIDLDGKKRANADRVVHRLSASNARDSALLRNEGLPSGMMWDRVLSVEEIGTDNTVAITVPDGNTYVSMFWEHNTFDNAGAEIENFWTGTMVPFCGAIAAEFEPITGSLDDRIHLEYDFSKVNVLQQAERKRIDQAKSDLTVGALSYDDYFEIIGKPKMNIASSRVHYLPNNYGILGAPDDVAEVTEQRRAFLGGSGGLGGSNDAVQWGTQSGNPFASIGNGTVGGNNDFVQQNAAANGGDSMMSVNQVAARALRASEGAQKPVAAISPGANIEVQERVEQLQKSLQRIDHEVESSRIQRFNTLAETLMKTWVEDLVNVSTERLEHSKVRKGTRHWLGEGSGDNALDVDYIVADDNWRRVRVKDRLEKEAFSLAHYQQTESYADTLFDTVVDNLKKTIAASDAEGVDLETIAIDIKLYGEDVEAKVEQVSQIMTKIGTE